jgi:hypothetical protein
MTNNSSWRRSPSKEDRMRLQKPGWFRRIALVALPVAIAALTASQAEASSIKLINKTGGSDVEFRVFQGDYQVGRVDVRSGKKASLATSGTYHLQAFLSYQGYQLTTNQLAIAGTSAQAVAQIVVSNGFVDAQLQEEPGLATGYFALENTSDDPAWFAISLGSGAATVVPVDPNSTVNFPTAQSYSVDAVANGDPIGRVSITDPNATVTAVQEEGAGPGSSGIVLKVR